MEEREVYPNAPVVLVALEIRHPTAGSLSVAERGAIKRRLTRHVPIMRMGRMQQLTLLQAVGEPVSLTGSQTHEFPRYFSRDNTMAVSIRDDAVVVETTRYERWEQLRTVLADLIEVRQEIGGVDGVERIGLRYVDEIRVANEQASGSGWASWVDPALLGPAQLGEELGLAVAESQGIMVFTQSADRTVVLRYGAREGYAVNPGGDLRRSTPSPGPYFLLDIDSFWAPGEGTPEFDRKLLLETCDALHAPVRSLFERLITERLREEVFRRGD